MKDKKSAGEMSKHKNSKQEAKAAAQDPEQAVVDGNALQNGDRPQKRAEKRRQSLGGFLKGLVCGSLPLHSELLDRGCDFHLPSANIEGSSCQAPC